MDDVIRDLRRSRCAPCEAGTPALTAAQIQPLLLAGVPGFPVQLNKDWTSQVDSHSVFDTEVGRFSIGTLGLASPSSWLGGSMASLSLTSVDSTVTVQVSPA